MYHKLRLLGLTPLLAAIAFAPSAHAAVSENIITTLYAYPTLPSWGQVESSAPTVGAAIVDICAPDGSGSGCNGRPADAKNPAWPATITALQKAGITPLYYISTNYGATSLRTIVTEMADAAMWYGVSSFMFDEMAPSGTCSDGGANLACTTYYRDLYGDSPSAKYMMFGPGTTYGTSAADIFGPKEVLQIFEGPATTEGSVTGFEETTFPAWMSGYASHYFSATLAAGTSSTIGTDISDAIKDGIGNFYETDEAEPPNYSTLPAYWSTEVSDAANGI